MDTYAIGEAAKAAGIGASTARDYLKAFPEYFSETAVPPAGGRRSLTWPDIETLATIKTLRKQGKAPEEIRATLNTGEREELQPQGEYTDSRPATALVVRLTAAAAQWEATAQTVVKERDHLRDELKESQDARLAAEIRAVEAETGLRILKELTEETPPQGEKTGFWQRIFGKR